MKEHHDHARLSPHYRTSRTLGANVSAANDELFAQRENLIRPEALFFDPNEFGHKGKV